MTHLIDNNILIYIKYYFHADIMRIGKNKIYIQLTQ